MCVGTVRAARVHDNARAPALVLNIDFGPRGTRTSSAQLTRRYAPEALVGRRVVAALGLPPKRVAGIVSTCLVLAAVESEGDAVLLAPDAAVADGTAVR